MLAVFLSSHLQYTTHFYKIQKDHSNAIATRPERKNPGYFQSHTLRG